MASWPGWAADVLAGLGDTASVSSLDFFNTWHLYEESTCSNNPLNTTQPEIGASNCNSVGVKSYPSPAVGTSATVTTLRNGYYPAILAALATGDPYTYHDPQSVAANITTWGTPAFAGVYLTRAGSPAGAAGGATPAAPPEGGPENSLAGWHQVNQALARHLPTSLQRTRILNRHTAINLARRARK